MNKIAILTSGGDAPGMNAAIRSAVRTAVSSGLDVLGVRRGFAGLIDGEIYPVNARSVSGIINMGGTILKTARSEEFRSIEGRQKASESIRKHGIGGLIVIGGDGSYRGADFLNGEGGLKVIGIPGTIDNDIAGTDYTIGFDTAVNTALEAIDRLRDTANSHDRLFIIEVMGRDSGFIGLYSALSGGAEGVLIPEYPTDLGEICRVLEEGRGRGKLSSILVVAEGDEEGGAFDIAGKIHDKIGYDVRVAILGHILRGGAPTALDRFIATKFGEHAVNLLLEGISGKAVGIDGQKSVYTSLKHAYTEKKHIEESAYRLVEKLAV